MDNEAFQNKGFEERYVLAGISLSEARRIVRDRLPEFPDLLIMLSEETGNLVATFRGNPSNRTQLNPLLVAFKREFSGYIATPPDTTLEDAFFHWMDQNHLHVSTAESCTGGLLAGRIINVPGASSILEEAFVTYSDRAKMKTLGVSRSILKTYGAYSVECAGEMAKCLKKLTSCELTVSTTGLAGPSGGSDAFPVGTVCFGMVCFDEVHTFKKWFSGDRNAIRNQAVSFALAEMIHLIQSRKMAKGEMMK